MRVSEMRATGSRDTNRRKLPVGIQAVSFISTLRPQTSVGLAGPRATAARHYTTSQRWQSHARTVLQQPARVTLWAPGDAGLPAVVDNSVREFDPFFLL